MAAPKGVYIIKSKNNKRCYVGSSYDINRRWRLHKSQLINNKHHSIILQNHVNKYGLDDLIFEILKECTIKELINLEQHYIDTLNPYFNIRKLANSNKGIKRTKETKLKISKANIGKKLSESTKAKMSERMIGNSYTKGMRPVNAKRIICIKTNKVFNKIQDAANYIGMKRTTLNAQLNGQNKNITTLKYM